MKSLRLIACGIFLIGASLMAQSGSDASPAGTASNFEASAGYLFMSMTSPSTGRLNLSGVDANGIVQITPRWGGMVDFGFARAGEVPGTGHSDRVFSALVGPVFYVMQHPKTTVFVHALFGTAWVNSAVLVSSTSEFKGYETRFSYAFGGGFERAISGPFALRVTADYQRTSFVDSTLALEGQNNLRLSTGLVYRFGNRSTR